MIGALVFVLISLAPTPAMATEWFGLSFPCITMFTVTFHWMTLLILIFMACCCCSPCFICCFAYSLQRRPSNGGVSTSYSSVQPSASGAPAPTGAGVNYALLKGYGDVFPQELRRTQQRETVAKKSRFSCMNSPAAPGACCGCLFAFVVICTLIVPLFSFTSYKLYDQIMMDMSYLSPQWVWVWILVVSSVAGIIGVVAICRREADGLPKTMGLYCPPCLGAVVAIVVLWGLSEGPFSKPFISRAGNEICRTFDSATLRPSICGAPGSTSTASSPVASTTPQMVVHTFGVSGSGVTKTQSSRRLAFRSSSSEVDDIDLDEDGGWWSSLSRRLDPAHDGATSYLHRLVAGGSYCVDTSTHSAAWTAPTYDEKAHNAAAAYIKTITTKEGCTATDEMCKNGSPASNFSTTTSCTCSGESVADVSGKLIGGRCNLWSFGDPAAWCFVKAGATSCGTVATYQATAYSWSAAPCDSGYFSPVSMRSKDLMKGYYQYFGVLVLGAILAMMSCSLACTVAYLNRRPKEKRYHSDNSLPWNDLVIAKAENAKMWEVLGWNQVNWEADDPSIYPRSEGKTWAQLTTKARPPNTVSEMEAAGVLGYTAHSWDGEALKGARDLATRGGSSAPETASDELVDAELADQFYGWNEEASKRITTATPEIKRMEIYGFYHQALQGNVLGLRPSRAEPDEQNKYDAWFRLRGMSRSQAMTKYVAAVQELPGGSAPTWGRK